MKRHGSSKGLVCASSSFLLWLSPLGAEGVLPELTPPASVSAEPSSRQVGAEISLETGMTTNVYQDVSLESGTFLLPSAALVGELGAGLRAGYEGQLELMSDHPELFSQSHALFVEWEHRSEEERRSALLAQLSFEALRADEAYAALNHLGLTFFGAYRSTWSSTLRLRGKVSGRIQFFPDASFSDALEVFPLLEATVTLKSRTTVSPRLGCGYRGYLHRELLTDEDGSEMQPEFGVHVSQGLWKTAGVQLDASARPLFEPNATLSLKLEEPVFAYLGTSFLYASREASIGLKQVLPKGVTLAGGLEVEGREYLGWPALDASSASLGVDREDFTTTGSLSVSWLPRGAQAPGAWLPEQLWSVSYSVFRQCSNSTPYDTQGQGAWLSVTLGW